MSYTIAEIETAMLDALQASALNSVCKKIAQYKGEISALLEEIEDFLIPEPSLYTLYTGSDYDNNRDIERQTWALVLVAKKLSEAYDLKEKTHAATYKNDFGLNNLLPFKPVKVELLLSTLDHVAYGFYIETFYSIG